MQNLIHYKQFADLFRYPDEKLLPRAKAFLKVVQTQMPEQAEKLSVFVSAIEKLSAKKQ